MNTLHKTKYSVRIRRDFCTFHSLPTLILVTRSKVCSSFYFVFLSLLFYNDLESSLRWQQDRKATRIFSLLTLDSFASPRRERPNQRLRWQSRKCVAVIFVEQRSSIREVAAYLKEDDFDEIPIVSYLYLN